MLPALDVSLVNYAYSESAIRKKGRPAMTTQNTTTVEICDNAHGATPGCGWGWPDEARLSDFVELNDRAEQIEQPVKDDSAYAVLYFVS
jgi:hypothetical protein